MARSFPHPSYHDRRVHVIFDICRMIKLARNTFSDFKIFCTTFNEKISWQHILLLYQTQQKDILHLRNKLRSQHVKWQNHKMKVKFATQLFSHSVSAAITFLRNIKLIGFKDSKPTSDFILLMNDVFDALNSKSKFGKNTKQPINTSNFYEIEGRLHEAIAFLKCLKDTTGMPLIEGPQNTFVIGFCISAYSILTISRTLLERGFPQDPIEVYFSKIRSRFGWNNNPTALQFKYAFRSLLLQNKIESPSTANCVPVSEQECSATGTGKVDSAVCDLLMSSNLWRADVLHYISGFVAIDCPECAAALYNN